MTASRHSRALRFTTIAVAAVSLASRLTLAQGFFPVPDDLPAAPSAIPTVATAKGQKFENAEVLSRKGDVLQIRHGAGMARLSVSSFDDANLDLLFPGYLARKNEVAAKARAKELRRAQRATEETQLVEAKLRAAVDEALHATDPDAAQKESLVALLVFGREKYEAGDEPQFAARIVNRSSKPVYLVTASAKNYPACSISFRDPAGNVGLPQYGSPRCGLDGAGSTGESSFVLVEPRQAFAPSDLQFRHMDPRIYAFDFDPSKPLAKSGTYFAQFRYSTTIPKDRDDPILGKVSFRPRVDPKAQHLFNQVPAVRMESKAVEITLPPIAER
jgi:hypothetical protein